MNKIIVVGDLPEEEKERYRKIFGDIVIFENAIIEGIEPGVDYVGAGAVVADVTIEGDLRPPMSWLEPMELNKPKEKKPEKPHPNPYTRGFKRGWRK